MSNCLNVDVKQRERCLFPDTKLTENYIAMIRMENGEPNHSDVSELTNADRLYWERFNSDTGKVHKRPSRSQMDSSPCLGVVWKSWNDTIARMTTINQF